MGEQSSDAERLNAIHDLERAIAARQPDLEAARARRNSARQLERGHLADLEAAEKQIKTFDKAASYRDRAVYLHGHRLDRGHLELGNSVLRFAGWYGKCAIDLADVDAIDIGSSNLPHRAGIPLLSRFWPGQPQPHGTLLITVRASDTEPQRQAVVADLNNAAAWREFILEQQARLQDVAASRQRLVDARASAHDLWSQAYDQYSAAEAALATTERELMDLVSRKTLLQSQQRQVEAARKRALREEQARLKGKKR